MENRVLSNHVIKSYQVAEEEQCRINCYLEPDCVSYNYGPLDGGLYLCELSDKIHEQSSPNELQAKNGFIFSQIFVVSKWGKL